MRDALGSQAGWDNAGIGEGVDKHIGHNTCVLGEGRGLGNHSRVILFVFLL